MAFACPCLALEARISQVIHGGLGPLATNMCVYVCIESQSLRFEPANNHFALYIGGWGVSPTGKSFCFVCARARSFCQVEFDLKHGVGTFFLFLGVLAEFSLSLMRQEVFPFSLVKWK